MCSEVSNSNRTLLYTEQSSYAWTHTWNMDMNYIIMVNLASNSLYVATME